MCVDLTTYRDISERDQLFARRLKENGVIVNEADIALACIRSGSRVGAMEVSPTAAAVSSESPKLVGRHTVIVFNDASIFLYWSFNSNPTIGVDTMPIPSGAIATFPFDPNDPSDIYLITSEFTTDVKVVEIK